MAENKKSFVMYADIYPTIKHLTDEQAGKIFKHILSYVNDENPKIEDSDIVTKLVFEPIKQQFKRDLSKWLDIKEKRSEAGKRSAEKRARQKEQKATNLTSVERVQQTLTNPTVSVNDSVTVTVNDILLEKETKELFNNWLDYRKEIKKPIKSEKTKISLAKKMQLKGYAKSKQVIDNSIENGWQGLFWDIETTKPKVATNRPTT